MSLVEDILDLMHAVLEYFGVPPDMLVPVWDSDLCGQYRSIVRMIGTNLPLTPAPRIHFQVPLLSYKPHGYVDMTVETKSIPSFADVLWVFEDEGESFAKTRNHLLPKKQSTVNREVLRYPPQSKAQRGGCPVRQTTDLDALQKITALESQLLKLQAQIAMIVTTAPASGLSETQKLIRRRRDNDKNLDKVPLKPQDSDVKGTPSMLDVLKDLSQVKLRSVNRSPGGTPGRRRRSKGGPALLSDPASLIAEALKRKFAQHRHNDSSDKENSLELSPFGSPEIPKIPVHIRRSQGRLHL
ncbi:Mitochondrial fission regulator 2 [Dissostichus eleginoides]|uniref:Mitochondrial fission regulator n=1 Tax=Dissostichus eleginoides TaxID=100907 RepID=A0AAD9BVX4_DISEL|nr:Mitochondrial fission regulator 2 [Dissostichus eleginoides]